jgi:hypothetical protein
VVVVWPIKIRKVYSAVHLSLQYVDVEKEVLGSTSEEETDGWESSQFIQ